jgi:hypothetical protein
MPAGNTYVALATQTLGSASALITFSSIPSTYTDLILVTTVTPAASGGTLYFRFNNDTATNYSFTELGGNGSAASSTRGTSTTSGLLFDYTVGMPASSQSTTITSFMNYSNTTTYKTAIGRGNNAATFVDANVSLWRSTSAVNRLDIFEVSSNNLAAGSTFTLYGIAAA